MEIIWRQFATIADVEVRGSLVLMATDSLFEGTCKTTSTSGKDVDDAHAGPVEDRVIVEVSPLRLS
eukprot:5639699-Amphidinium_carterae.1